MRCSPDTPEIDSRTATPRPHRPCTHAGRVVDARDNLSYVKSGDPVTRGAIFGMIRIGSQVDVVVPWRDGMTVRVRPGDRVRAGETVLVD